jgi:hypothetical protein
MRGWSAQTITTDEAQPSSSPEQRHASWYAQGHSDPIGDRLLMFDNSRGPSLELLRFSWRVTGSPDFEIALRERVDQLSLFRHDAFARIRAVEVLAPQHDLTLVSNYVAGKRLSESLAAFRGPVFAEWLIRELVPALADFQEYAPGLAHGALTGDRIVLTPEGHLVVVEHVLGSALQRLQLTPNNLWLRFGIGTPPGQSATAVLDQQADVFQLALLAIAVLIGRPLASYEYPQHVEAILATFERSTGPALPPSLRSWLTRALHLGGPPFESARDAQNSLGELRTAPSSPQLAGARMAVAGAQTIDRAMWALETAGHEVADTRPPFTSAAELSGSTPSTEAEPRELFRKPESDELLHRYPRSRTGVRDYLLAAFVAIAVAQMGYITYLVYMKAPSIVVQAPQTSQLSRADRAPTAEPSSPPAMPLSLQPLVAGPRPRDTATPLAEPVRQGRVRILSPLELQVFEGDRVLGSSAGGAIAASAGRHELELVNRELGYRTRRVVNLKGGEVVSVSLPHPEGRLSINASPWADVWIDNTHVGETPLANLSIPIGEHEVTFRHPAFGEQRRTVVVRFDSPARVSADLR